MTILNVTFDTQCVSASDITALVQGGQTLHTAGIINVRWEDFSASDVARDAGLTEVVWDCVADDTAGTLALTVWYSQLAPDLIRQRVAEVHGVEEWDVESRL